jgi:hypothetical protein
MKYVSSIYEVFFYFTAFQDVSVKLAPLQIYIEDKYIYHLKKCFMDMMPTLLCDTTTTTKPSASNMKYTTSQKKQRAKPTVRNQTENTEKVKQKHKLRTEENSAGDYTSKEVAKKDLSEEGEEEDLFNVSEPEDNQSPEDTVEEVVSEALPYEADSVWPVDAAVARSEEDDPPPETLGFPVPAEVVSSSRDLARPLRLRSLSISQLDLLVSIHTSTKFYIALDHSPLQLSPFRRSSLFTTAYRLGHALTLHYFFGAIYGTGEIFIFLFLVPT